MVLLNLLESIVRRTCVVNELTLATLASAVARLAIDNEINAQLRQEEPIRYTSLSSHEEWRSLRE
eukprot:1893300-Pyramimonas_sp.AAC.1